MIEILRLIDDLVGAVYDIMKFISASFCYFLVGMLIVSIPLYLVILPFKYFV